MFRRLRVLCVLQGIEGSHWLQLPIANALANDPSIAAFYPLIGDSLAPVHRHHLLLVPLRQFLFLIFCCDQTDLFASVRELEISLLLLQRHLVVDCVVCTLVIEIIPIDWALALNL
jgi:hypothetical protein